jgi:hypothetical protein
MFTPRGFRKHLKHEKIIYLFLRNFFNNNSGFFKEIINRDHIAAYWIRGP